MAPTWAVLTVGFTDVRREVREKRMDIETTAYQQPREVITLFIKWWQRRKGTAGREMRFTGTWPDWTVQRRLCRHGGHGDASYLLSETLCQAERDQRRHILTSFSCCPLVSCQYPSVSEPPGNQLCKGDQLTWLIRVCFLCPQEEQKQAKIKCGHGEHQHSYRPNSKGSSWVDFVKMNILCCFWGCSNILVN